MPARSLTTSFRAILLISAGLLVSGCGSSVEKAIEETTEQTQAIDPVGTLSIRNSLGSVRIHGSEGSEMKLSAVKRAWSANQLKGIALTVSGQSNALSIETTFPPRKSQAFSSHTGSVDLAITLPRTAKIARLEIGNGDVLIEDMRGDFRANLVNGALAARNCFGNAQISVAQGGLDLFYEKWQPQRFSVEATIISGNARAFLPGQASFHLQAEAVNGHVANGLDPAEARSSRATKVKLLVGAEDSSDIRIRAINGNIEIAPAKTD
jgi:hypothetical protein